MRIPANVKNDPIAKKQWLEIIKSLKELDILNETDQQFIELAAITYSRWQRNIQTCAELGETAKNFKGDGCVAAHAKAADNQAKQLRDLLAHLGLSPLSRKRIALKKKKPPQSDKWKGTGLQEVIET